ncbi:hypothetical protein KAFR_0I00200 [Kazachstania africana CBS 2517]|uniref:Uncharacterized protein n=1 Tax=Kazachstania africana (strain ATCC 22294 / BCRC 22015 / CBS 2517 / CECT 1963 / NBRC 1671 / NRRL Y-8276) TaxID=1071382 RepID=H2AZK1_KAZAF|nr:hypothetical protein KAFR_0I00200 [Kazachstania africana CBS 2517]CCF59801.1 hypothetical protein KAFR_0I00200 [Kazachstania africana CBS 2517]
MSYNGIKVNNDKIPKVTSFTSYRNLIDGTATDGIPSSFTWNNYNNDGYVSGNKRLECKILPYCSNYFSIRELSNQENKVLNFKNPMQNFTFPNTSPPLSYSHDQNEFNTFNDQLANANLSKENEYLLKRYYENQKPSTFANLRRNSVLSSSDSSKLQNEKLVAISIVKEFITNPKLPNSMLSQICAIKPDMITTHAASSFFKYEEKLATINVHDWNVFDRQTLWVPSVREDLRYLLLDQIRLKREGDSSKPVNKEDPCDIISSKPIEKTAPLFIDGEKYIPEEYDSYLGSSLISSTFSEFKMPALVYHTAIELNGHIYVLGGLLPSYRYDEEAPNLDDFIVDGINNLPPPLLSSVINNPAMLSNPCLFDIYAFSSRVTKPDISGNLPPPLLCAKASKLTDRYLFFYGGFEVKVETKFDELINKYIIKKRIMVNSNGFVLDTMTFKFTKIDVLVQKGMPSKFTNDYHVKQTDTAFDLTPRFGHLQVSFNKDVDESQSNNGRNSTTVTIIIFGGYRQTTNNRFVAMNDTWKIDIPIISRNKRGYCEFGKTATAAKLIVDEEDQLLPSERAFFGYCLYNNYPCTNFSIYEKQLLDDLKQNFEFNGAYDSDLDFDPETFMNKEDLENIRRIGVNTNEKRGGKNRTDVPKTIIIHGGSNNFDVFGDLWWFDLESLTWNKLDISAKINGTLQPVELKLVGHTMVNIGHVAIFSGGLLEEDIEELYFGRKNTIERDNQISLSLHFLNTIDLHNLRLLEKK